MFVLLLPTSSVPIRRSTSLAKLPLVVFFNNLRLCAPLLQYLNGYTLISADEICPSFFLAKIAIRYSLRALNLARFESCSTKETEASNKIANFKCGATFSLLVPLLGTGNKKETRDLGKHNCSDNACEISFFFKVSSISTKHSSSLVKYLLLLSNTSLAFTTDLALVPSSDLILQAVTTNKTINR